jgi:uroporphyrin-III C-methyltransferase/precorrin-2 dehydrogenase/sirohydrochlorin ferrochelatase
MDYLPIFAAVRGQRCVVVGGGEVAQRKIALLREAGARVLVVAPELSTALTSELRAASFEHVPRAYQRADLDGARVVIAATDDADVNARVASDAQALGVLVNVVDQPALCSFVMPSIIDRAPVLVAVSTGGASPVLARMTRGAIEAALPSRLGALAAFAAKHRTRVKSRLNGVPARRAFWERALRGEPGQLVLAGRDAEAERAFESVLSDGGSAHVRVCLIGTGAGDPEQLPLAVLRALGGADLVLHADGVPESVLALARRDAARLPLGIADASTGLPAAALARLVAEAKGGAAVCLLRAGDPYEHADAADCRQLREAGVGFVRLRPAPAPATDD